VSEVTATADQHGADLAPWWAEGEGLLLVGRSLATAGVAAPVLAPETARVLRVVSEDGRS